MLEDLKNELSSFLKDLSENIKDPDDLIYIRNRTEKLVDVIFNEMDKILNYNEDKLNALIKKQEQEDMLIQELKQRLEDIYEDIYDEEEGDFAIICPYCNYEFDADIDENFEEIRCPECGNAIELDWDGNPDDEPDLGSGCGENCPHCGGCE